MNETDDAFDILLLIAVLVVFTPLMLTYAIPYMKGEVGGFDVQLEKTAKVTQSELVPIERTITTDDVIFMLLIADRYTPDPGIIQLSNESRALSFQIDEAFFRNREVHLLEAREVFPTREPVSLNLQAGSATPIQPDDWSGRTGMQFWQADIIR